MKRTFFVSYCIDRTYIHFYNDTITLVHVTNFDVPKTLFDVLQAKHSDYVVLINFWEINN